MTALTIHHRTTYRYRQPLACGPHPLMLDAFGHVAEFATSNIRIA